LKSTRCWGTCPIAARRLASSAWHARQARAGCHLAVNSASNCRGPSGRAMLACSGAGSGLCHVPALPAAHLQQHLPSAGVVEAQQQAEDGGLAAARGAHDGAAAVRRHPASEAAAAPAASGCRRRGGCGLNCAPARAARCASGRALKAARPPSRPEPPRKPLTHPTSRHPLSPHLPPPRLPTHLRPTLHRMSAPSRYPNATLRSSMS
jgi:hypothetical protein